MKTFTIKRSLAIAVALVMVYLLAVNLYLYDKNKQLHKKHADVYWKAQQCNRVKENCLNEQNKAP